MAFPTYSLTLAGASSQSASVNGTNTGLTPTTDFTIEAWVNFTTPPTSGNIMAWLGGRWTYASSNRSYAPYILNVAGVWDALMETSDSGSNAITARCTGITAPVAGTWEHHAYVYTISSGNLQHFLNGVADGTPSVPGLTSFFNSGVGFRIGNTNDGAFPYFDGKVALFRFWAEARSGAQLLANQCTVLGSQTNLSAEWIWDGTGDYTDNSGNSNTLTGNNTPTFTTSIPSVCAVVGPANWKTYNTNAKANIKTLNTNTLANTKTYDTIS